MFNDFILQGIAKNNYAMILSLLLSLRQCCDHPFLLISRAKGLLKRSNEETIEKALTSQFINQLYNDIFHSRQDLSSYAQTVIKEIQDKGSVSSLICPVSLLLGMIVILNRFAVILSVFIPFSPLACIISVKNAFHHWLNKQEYF